MNPKRQKAIETFKSGFNCAQAVITAYADDLKLDINQAQMMSAGFGAGMGRLQETCGAVTGAYMILGFYYCENYTDNKERKDKIYSSIQKFSKEFKSIHKATDCKNLLNCDLKTEEGQRYAQENNLLEVVCEKCISDSVSILEELMEN